MILAATGHRPNKLGGYSPAVSNKLRLLAHKYLAKTQPWVVISGMALGWDVAVAEASLLAGIPFIAAVPFAGQESQWPAPSQRAYGELLARAYRVYTISEGGYSPHKMQLRNEWMVKHCDRVVALWDGSPGGTANCMGFINKLGVPYDNLWDEFAFFS